MAYNVKAYAPSFHSNFEDPDSFVDDDSDSELVPLERHFVTRNLTSKSIILLMITLAVLAICIGIGIIAKGSENKKHATDQSRTIPSVPVDLHVVCAPMNLHSDRGYQICLELCQPAQCCELAPDNEGSCVEGHRHKCELYRASCKHLDYHNVTISELVSSGDHEIMFSIPYEVEKACNPTQISTIVGVKKCFDVCQHHLCCFDEIEAAACTNINPNECDLYTACQVLVDVSASKEAPSETCTEGVIEAMGTTKCLDSCSRGYCCLFDERYESSCATDDICSNFYKPCQMLAPKTPPEEDPNLVKRVKKDCTENSMQDNAVVKECQKDCAQRPCCTQTGAGNCDFSDREYCTEVSGCHLLNKKKEESETQLNSSAKRVASALLEKNCATDSLLTLSGFHDCYDKCFYHSCCFAKYPGLRCEYDIECSEYSPCAQLFSRNDSTIEAVCAPSSIETSTGLSKCREQCSGRLCCFQDPNLPSSCMNILGKEECDQYKECSILVSASSHRIYDDKDAYLVSRINHFCQAENIDNDYCKAQCQKRGCCFFKGVDNCFSNNQAWCEEVSACLNHPDIDFPYSSGNLGNNYFTSAPVFYGGDGNSGEQSNNSSDMALSETPETELDEKSNNLTQDTINEANLDILGGGVDSEKQDSNGQSNNFDALIDEADLDFLGESREDEKQGNNEESNVSSEEPKTNLDKNTFSSTLDIIDEADALFFGSDGGSETEGNKSVGEGESPGN
mmetsp:Transcript_14685/g.16798  ORF Transcript_14685/g.16798 Transcript_14685/m.16798 type:complete len:736 (-) Transcript_14685:235-2442(-)